MFVSVLYMLLQFIRLYEEEKLIFGSAVTFYCTPEPLTPLSSGVSPSGIHCCVSVVCYSRYFIIYVAVIALFVLCFWFRLNQIRINSMAVSRTFHCLVMLFIDGGEI